MARPPDRAPLPVVARLVALLGVTAALAIGASLGPGAALGTRAAAVAGATSRAGAAPDARATTLPGPASIAPSSPPSIAPAPTPVADPRAHTAFAAFLAAYWDPGRGTFVRLSGASSIAVRPRADVWWEAQAWETVLDAYQAGDPLAPRSLVDAVFDGQERRGFAGDYNDDASWWAMASLRAFDLTGQPRALATARAISDAVWLSWDPHSGGVWWRRSVRDQKNVATNATAVIVAAQLYRLTHESRFRDRAIAIFGWLEAHLRRGDRILDRVMADGRVVAGGYTYDYGQYLGAAREMATLTGDGRDLGLAEDLADTAMTLGRDRILPDEGTGDGGGFKGILVRQLALLADQTGLPRYLQFLDANAAAAWDHRRSGGLWGSSWLTTPRSGSIEVLTDISAVRLFEQLAILSMRPG